MLPSSVKRGRPTREEKRVKEARVITTTPTTTTLLRTGGGLVPMGHERPQGVVASAAATLPTAAAALAATVPVISSEIPFASMALPISPPLSPPDVSLRSTRGTRTRVDGGVRMHPLSLEFDDPEMESAYRVRAGERGAVGAYSNAAIIAVHAAGLLGDTDLWDSAKEPCVLKWPRLLPITMNIVGALSCNPVVASLCAPTAVREGDVTQRKLHQHAVIVGGGVLNMVLGPSVFAFLSFGIEEQRRAAGCVDEEMLSAPFIPPPLIVFVFALFGAVTVIEHILAFPIGARLFIDGFLLITGFVLTFANPVPKGWPVIEGADPFTCICSFVLLGEMVGYAIQRHMRRRFLATRFGARGVSPHRTGQSIVDLSELGLVDCALLGHQSEGISKLDEVAMGGGIVGGMGGGVGGGWASGVATRDGVPAGAIEKGALSDERRGVVDRRVLLPCLALDKTLLDATLDSTRAGDNAGDEATSGYGSSGSMSQSTLGDDAQHMPHDESSECE